MKNILIIAKMNLFSKEISQNRYSFLKFLDSKPNIRVIDDLPRHINKTLQKQAEQGFNVDIIIYYALSANEKWRDIKTINFNKCKLKKILVFEDYLYIGLCTEMFIKYNFNELILLKCHNKFMRLYSEKIGKPPLLWNHFVDTEVFKERNQKKKYKLLLYGFCLPGLYPIRARIKFFMKELLKKYPNARIKVVEHPGYDNIDLSKAVMQQHLSKLINESCFTIATSSVAGIFVKKYIEIPLSGSILVGDIPKGYDDLLQNNIVEIPQTMKDDDIFKKLLDVINGKYDYMLDPERINKFAETIKSKYSYEQGYNKLLQILNISG
jgi:hypothetical protein